MKKTALVALLLIGVIASAFCGGSSETSKTSTETTKTTVSIENTNMNVAAVSGISETATLRVAVDGEPSSLFPAYQQSKVDNRVNSSMFNYLVEWDDDAKVAKPSLATSWEWIDSTHIRFTLRDDVYFTNGEKMVAEDVAQSLAFSCLYHGTYTQMFDPDNFVVEDDTHVVIALSRPYGNLLDILGCDYYTVFDWSAFVADGSDTGTWMRNPVGSGPYKLKEWVTGDHITLERNDNYWDKENLPYYKYIVYYFISDQSARTSALESGSVDIAYNVAISQIEELKAAGLTVNPYNQNVTKPLTFNMRKNPALADENVRKAIFYAIDKAALAEADHYGYGLDNKSSLTGPNSSYYYECETFYQDLSIAKAAIEEAKAKNGWTDADLTFTTWAVSGSDTSQVELLQYYLSTIGITLKIESADLAVVLFEHLFVGDTSISVAENDTWDITRMLNMVDSRISTSYDAYIGEGEDELHALIDAAWASDEASSYDAYAKVQQWLADHYVTTAIDNCLLVDAWNSKITGILYDAHCWPNVWAMRPVL